MAGRLRRIAGQARRLAGSVVAHRELDDLRDKLREIEIGGRR